MTEYEHLMLSIIFGATIGFMISPWFILLKEKICSRRKKKQIAQDSEKQ